MLQQTYDSIQGYEPVPESLISKWLSFGKSKAAPKGLYIWGAVGGGKTMLMDLFHETVATEKKKRMHFNAFMLDIHRRIHSLKTSFAQSSGDSRSINYDPIPPVAERIAEESWLICFDEFQVKMCTDLIFSKLDCQS